MTHAQETQHPAERKDGPRASAGAARGRPPTPGGHQCTRAGSLVPTFEKEPVRDLNHDFKELCRHNRDGSYATQADREHILDLIADQLHEMGHRGLRAQGLKPKHVEKLVARWLGEELSPGTIKKWYGRLPPIGPLASKRPRWKIWRFPQANRRVRDE